MSRNKGLELEWYAPGRWKTSDGRFIIIKQAEPIDPMKFTEDWKIKYVYSIRDYREYAGPMEWPELAPEIDRVDTQGQIFAKLGQITGEGSFKEGSPRAVRWGGLSEESEAEASFGASRKWIDGIKKWWKNWIGLFAKIPPPGNEQGSLRVVQLLKKGADDIENIKQTMMYQKGFFPGILSGNREADIPKKKKLFNPMREGFYLLDDVIGEIVNIYGNLSFDIHACYNQDTLEYKSRPDIREKKWGKNRDLNGCDAYIESQISDELKKADSIFSGKFIKKMTSELAAIEKGRSLLFSKSDKVDLDFDISGMKIHVIPTTLGKMDPWVFAKGEEHFIRPESVSRLSKAIIMARDMIKKAGFGKTWYGGMTVYPESMSRTVAVGSSGDTGKSLAQYLVSKDAIDIHLSGNYSKDELAVSIAHELGHRWYFKFMTRGDRARFDSWFGDVPAVRQYGTTNAMEDFATVFEYYVMGYRLSRDQRERFVQFAVKPSGIRRQEGIELMKRVVSQMLAG